MLSKGYMEHTDLYTDFIIPCSLFFSPCFICLITLGSCLAALLVKVEFKNGYEGLAGGLSGFLGAMRM